MNAKLEVSGVAFESRARRACLIAGMRLRQRRNMST
jgi:hypothetical protein